MYLAGNDQHCWEFVTPIVGFPPGWFHIESAKTGDLLSNTYRHNPPILLPPPSSLKPSQYREAWGFQWTLDHSGRHNDPATKTPRNSWRIVNRLTRIHLSPQFIVVLPQALADFHGNLDWQLELDPSCNWKIKNRKTSLFLEQTNTPRAGGTAVACDDRVFALERGSQSWILRYFFAS